MEELLQQRVNLDQRIKELKKVKVKVAYNEYHKKYQNDKYSSDPAFAEHKKNQILEKYHKGITEEEKQKRRDRSKAYYEANKGRYLADKELQEKKRIYAQEYWKKKREKQYLFLEEF